MWKLVGERALAGPFAGDTVEHIVAALLPTGTRTPFLDRALVGDVAAAVLYLQHRRGIDQVCLQCYQRCDDGEPSSSRSVTHKPAPCGCTPAGSCGWSFFLVEKTLENGRADVQAYLFHE